jgi:hypothetical protein
MREVVRSQKFRAAEWAKQLGPEPRTKDRQDGEVSRDYGAAPTVLTVASVRGRTIERDMDPDDVISPVEPTPDHLDFWGTSPYFAADRFTREFEIPEDPCLVARMRRMRNCSFWKGESFFLLPVSGGITRHLIESHLRKRIYPNESTLKRMRRSLRMDYLDRKESTINGYIRLGEKHGRERTTVSGGPLIDELRALQLLLPWEKLNFALRQGVNKRHLAAREILEDRVRRAEAVAVFFARTDDKAVAVRRGYSAAASTMVRIGDYWDYDAGVVPFGIPFYEAVRPLWRLESLIRSCGKNVGGPRYLNDHGICYRGQNRDTEDSLSYDFPGPMAYEHFTPFTEEKLAACGDVCGEPVATPSEVGWIGYFTDFFA